jgi:hypothetical protein
MWRAAWALPFVCTALAACGSGAAATSAAPPPTQAVSDAQAKALLARAFRAARALGRAEHTCRGCYPTDTSEITEDMSVRTHDQYAVAFTPFSARLPGVVYLDTVGAGRLTRDHITLYARTSNGTIWQLRAGTGAPHVGRSE